MLNLIKLNLICPICGERFEFETISPIEHIDDIICPSCMLDEKADDYK